MTSCALQPQTSCCCFVKTPLKNTHAFFFSLLEFYMKCWIHKTQFRLQIRLTRQSAFKKKTQNLQITATFCRALCFYRTIHFIWCNVRIFSEQRVVQLVWWHHDTCTKTAPALVHSIILHSGLRCYLLRGDLSSEWRPGARPGYCSPEDRLADQYWECAW